MPSNELIKKILKPEILLIAFIAIFSILVLNIYGYVGLLKFNQFASPSEIYAIDSNANQLTVYSNGHIDCTLCGKKIELIEGNNILNYCFDNSIDLNCSNREIYFNRLDYAEIEKIEINSVERNFDKLKINAAIYAKEKGFAWIEYFSNEKSVLRPFSKLEKGKNDFSETATVTDASVKSINVVASGKNFKETENQLKSLDGLNLDYFIAAVLLVIFSAFIALRTKNFLVFLISFIVLAIFSFQFNSLVQISLSAYVIFLSILLFLFMEKRKNVFSEMAFEKPPIAIICFIVLFVLLVNLLISSHNMWGSYYFRHAETTARNGTVFYQDNLSYLGRPFTYPPAFMEFSAMIYYLIYPFFTNFESIELIEKIIIGLLFAFATYLLLDKYDSKKKLLGFVLLNANSQFVFAVTGISIHLLSYAIAFIAIYLFSKNEKLIAWLLLGAAFAVHPLTIVFYPVFWLFFNKFDYSAIKSGIILALPSIICAFFAFYLPIFLLYGLPYEIMPEKWGFLLSYGFDAYLVDFAFLSGAFAFSILITLIEKKNRSIALLLALSLAVYLAVTARMITFLAFLSTAIILQSDFFEKNKKILYCLAGASFLIFFLLFVGTSQWCGFGDANAFCLNPLKYVEKYTSSNESIALNPFFGHLAAHVANRPVLADLYVEYADKQKLMKEYDFYFYKKPTDANTMILDDYLEAYYNLRLMADYNVQNDNYSINSDAYSRRRLDDKNYLLVYNNGFMSVYRNGKNG